MKTLFALLILLSAAAFVEGQTTNSIPLWPEGAPGALGKADKDVPTLTPYLAEAGKATGGAFVICPRGGYAGRAPHEGADYARFLNGQEIAGFVFEDCLGPGGHQFPARL